MPYNYLYLYLLMDMPYKYKKIFCGYDLYFYIYGLGPDRNDNAGGTEEGAALPSCTHMRCKCTMYGLGPDWMDDKRGSEEGAALPSCTHMRCMYTMYGLGQNRMDDRGGTEEGAALPSCTHMRCMFTLYSLGQYQWTIEEVQRRVLDLFHAHIGEPIEKSVVPYSQFKCSRQKMRKLKISKLRA